MIDALSRILFSRNIEHGREDGRIRICERGYTNAVVLVREDENGLILEVTPPHGTGFVRTRQTVENAEGEIIKAVAGINERRKRRGSPIGCN